MLSSNFDGQIDTDDIAELLSGLKSNVRHCDDWAKWVDDESWSDGKVHAALEEIQERLDQATKLGAKGNTTSQFNGLTVVTCLAQNINLTRCISLGKALEPHSLVRVEPAVYFGREIDSYRVVFQFEQKENAENMLRYNDRKKED